MNGCRNEPKTPDGEALKEVGENEIGIILEAVGNFRSVVGELFGDFTLNELLALLTAEKVRNAGGKLTMSELASALRVSKPAVSQLVDRLEKRDCVERYTEKGDRRVVYVRLTQRARYPMGTEKESDEMIKKYFERMGEADIAQLKRIMEKSMTIMRALREEREQGETKNA